MFLFFTILLSKQVRKPEIECIMRRYRLFLLITIVLLLATCRDHFAEEKPGRKEESYSIGGFRAISYNVQFLPAIARHTNKRSQPLYRAQQIARNLEAFDIIGLNETFDDEPRQIIYAFFKKKWGKQCHIIYGPDPRDGRFSGGLSLISRYPFLETNSVIYKNFSSPLKYGVHADGFAAKGVLHARIQLPDKSSHQKRELDVFVTHFEARDGSMRRKQFDELAGFIRQHVSGETDFILLGDLNTRGNAKYRLVPNSTYNQLFGVLNKAVPEHRLVDTWPACHPERDGGTKYQTKPTGGPRIDYIIIGQAKKRDEKLQVENVRVNPYLDEKVEALSDHSAVEATLKWHRFPKSASCPE